MNKTTTACLSAALALNFTIGAHDTFAATCEYYLTAADDQGGAARVRIKDTQFSIEFWGATPNTLYTIWTDHRNRATKALADDYPLKQGALERGVAPTFASTAGVTSGMGLDVNSVITDSGGNGKLKIELDYHLLRKGDSPVVGAGLAMQGRNRVGGGWMRVYTNPDTEKEASLQKTDPKTGLPLLERSTAQGITIVQHPDQVSHGHTPGIGGVDHFPGFFGDFPDWCRTAEDDDDEEDDD